MWTHLGEVPCGFVLTTYQVSAVLLPKAHWGRVEGKSILWTDFKGCNLKLQDRFYLIFFIWFLKPQVTLGRKLADGFRLKGFEKSWPLLVFPQPAEVKAMWCLHAISLIFWGVKQRNGFTPFPPWERLAFAWQSNLPRSLYSFYMLYWLPLMGKQGRPALQGRVEQCWFKEIWHS